MSGGHFDYQQYRIRDIADSIDEYINGREIYEDDIESYKREYERGWLDKDEWEYIKEHHRTIPNHYNFSYETLEEFKKGYEILRIAEIYSQRIDWLLSFDDGEDTFHKRLKEDLDKFHKEQK